MFEKRRHKITYLQEVRSDNILSIVMINPISFPIVMKQDWCVLFLVGDFYSSMQSKQKQSVKILELLVYTAAQRGAKQFIEMIFSTSSQRIVFDSYKDRAQLPEDVARANGHCSLAQYLEDITTR